MNVTRCGSTTTSGSATGIWHRLSIVQSKRPAGSRRAAKRAVGGQARQEGQVATCDAACLDAKRRQEATQNTARVIAQTRTHEPGIRRERMSAQFHQTVMGQRFFAGQLPRLIGALEKLADAADNKTEPEDTNDNAQLLAKALATVIWRYDAYQYDDGVPVMTPEIDAAKTVLRICGFEDYEALLPENLRIDCE